MVRRLFPILFIVFIDGMGATILIPILPFYAIAYGAGPATVGLLLTSYALAQIVAGPALGRLSDRVGRKPVLGGAQVGTFISLLILGFAGSLPVIFLSRILDGLTGANLSTVQSAVADVTPPDRRAAGLGLVGAASGLGFITGPLLSGLALTVFDNDYSAPAFLAAGFSFASIVLTTVVFKETLPPGERSSTARTRQGSIDSLIRGVRSRDLGPLYLLAMGVQIVFTMFTATFTLFTLNRLGFDSLSNAIFLGLFGLMLVSMQGVFVGRLVARFGEFRVLAVSLGMGAVGFLSASLAPQQAVPWYRRDDLVAELGQGDGAIERLSLLPPEAGAGFGAFVFVLVALLPGPLGYTLQLPTINTLLTNRASRAETGETLGVSSAFVSVGTVTGPLLGGLLFQRFEPGTPFAVAGMISAGLLFLLVRRLRTSVDTRQREPTLR